MPPGRTRALCPSPFHTLASFIAIGLLLVITPGSADAQTTSSRYAKQDILIPMRDGVKLYTVIYTPRDTSRKYPVMMERTPYGVPYGASTFPGVLGPSRKFTDTGYIVVYQDVRGTHLSEGDYENMRPELKAAHGPKDIDESTDTYDTIDWIIKHVPNNNGRVGMWGISYPGFYAACGAIRSHPALKAVSPQAPIADWFLGDDDHHNGAFYLQDNFSWDFGWGFDWPRAGPSRTLPAVDLHYNSDNAYQFYLGLGPLSNANERYFKGRVPFWNDLMAHETYDSYWKAHSLLPHLHDIRPALLLVSGWFDAEDFFGPFHIFHGIEQASPRTTESLVVGPWPHGGWAGGPGSSYGGIPWDTNTGETYRNEVEFPFFDYYLNGNGAPPDWKARVFCTGSNRWMSFNSWPPADLSQVTLYLGNGGTLADGPAQSANQNDSDSYTSDPASPVPYSPFNGIERDSRYIIADQRFVDSRADVLKYRTEPLPHDVTMMGPITVDFHVSTTGTDGDWVVKVIDQYPDGVAPNPGQDAGQGGYEMLVRADVMRGKFRSSFEHPEPFVAGKITHLKFNLPDVCHTFKPGHRILVEVQSSWFPLVDRNPQTFCDISKATESDFKKAEIHIYRSAQYPSRIVFGTRGTE